MISRQVKKNPERVTEPVESKGWKMGFLGRGGGRIPFGDGIFDFARAVSW